MLMSEFREALALRREKVYHILDGYLGEKGIKFDPEDYQETSARNPHSSALEILHRNPHLDFCVDFTWRV